MREVLNAVFYVLSTNCQWQALPKDLPSKSTVWDDFSRWEGEGTIGRIHHALYVAMREQAGGEATLTTANVASQSARRVIPTTRGFDSRRRREYGAPVVPRRAEGVPAARRA